MMQRKMLQTTLLRTMGKYIVICTRSLWSKYDDTSKRSVEVIFKRSLISCKNQAVRKKKVPCLRLVPTIRFSCSIRIVSKKKFPV